MNEILGVIYYTFVKEYNIYPDYSESDAYYCFE